MLRENTRRSVWAIALSGLGFFFAMLLPALMQIQRALKNLRLQDVYVSEQSGTFSRDIRFATLRDLRTIIGAGDPVTKMVFVVLAVVCGVAVFAYLHSRQKVDFYHSLPVSRAKLFAVNYVTGVACVLPMYFLFLAITLVCVCVMGFGEAVSFSVLSYAIITNLVCFLLIYSLSALATILCGNTVISLLLLVWILFSPMFVKGIQVWLCEDFYTTYTSTTQDMAWAMHLSPVAQYFGLMGPGEEEPLPGSSFPVLAAYLVLTVAVVALSVWLFKIRKSERSGSALVFEPMKVPVKVYMCFVIGAVAGLLFKAVGDDLWLWIGLALGVIIFHAVVEIIYAFDFKAFKANIVHMGIILAVLAAAMAGLRFDMLGMQDWVPSESSIAKVNIDRGMSGFDNCDGLSSPEDIHTVLEIAELGVNVANGTLALEPESREYDADHISITVSYELNSGRWAARNYYIYSDTPGFAELMNKITMSEEYKLNKLEFLGFEGRMERLINADPAKSNWDYDSFHYNTPCISIFTGVYPNTVDEYGNEINISNEPKRIEDKEQVLEVLHTFRDDVLARAEAGEPLLKISFGWVDEQINGVKSYSIDTEAIITSNDVKTLALIKELTGVEPLKLKAEDVSSVMLEISGLDEQKNVYDTKMVEVTDKEDIKRILEGAYSYALFNISSYFDRWGSAEYGVIYLPYSQWGVSAAALIKSGEMETSICWPEGKMPMDIMRKYAGELTLLNASQLDAFLNENDVDTYAQSEIFMN